jgi:hypothetical protein
MSNHNQTMKPPHRVDEMTIKKLVAHYRRSEYPRLAREETEAYRKLRPHLNVAIQNAVKISPINGRKHPHQWKLPSRVLSEAQSKLLAASKAIMAAKDFDELYSIVQREIGSIDGVGDLTVYDVAHRIGAFLGKEPKLVYLHAGTAEGAELLGFTGSTVDKKELPEAFSPLTCAEIEDFLCIFKDRLGGQSPAKLTPKCFLPKDDLD